MSTPASKEEKRRETFAICYFLGGLILTIVLGIINILFGIIALILFFISIFVRIYMIEKKAQKVINSQSKLYGEEQPPNFNTFYFGCFVWDDKEFNIDIVRAGIKIISNGTIEILDSVFENETEKNMQKAYIVDHVLEQLQESNYGAGIDMKSELEDLVWNINKIIDKKKLPVKEVMAEQITAFDNEHMKARRKDNMITMDNDINILHILIKQQGYELVGILSDGDYFLTIITQEDFVKLIELEGKAQSNM